VVKRLAPCPDCGMEISTRAIVCPRCGGPLRVALLLAVSFALVVLGVYIARVAEMLHQMLR
jgi:predicted amidophosphoribosyltransferase